MPADFEFTHIDEAFVTLTIWREARGDGYDAMEAVANVIKNNAITEKVSVYTICTQKNEFSSMTVHTDPQTTNFAKEQDGSWKMAQTIALEVLSGSVPDITKGARYYCVSGKEEEDAWFYNNIKLKPEDHPLLEKIGTQDFYA